MAVILYLLFCLRNCSFAFPPVQFLWRDWRRYWNRLRHQFYRPKSSRPWRPSLNHPLSTIYVFSSSFPSIRIPPCARGPSSEWIISGLSSTSRIGCCAFTCCGFPIPNSLFISDRALSDNWMLMDFVTIKHLHGNCILKTSPITPFNTFKRLSIGTSLIELFVSAFSSSSSVYCKLAGEAADAWLRSLPFRHDDTNAEAKYTPATYHY